VLSSVLEGRKSSPTASNKSKTTLSTGNEISQTYSHYDVEFGPKALNPTQGKLAPGYLAELCIPLPGRSSCYHLRYTASRQLIVSPAKLSTYEHRAFAISGPMSKEAKLSQLKFISTTTKSKMSGHHSLSKNDR